jgi:hypothetical protein
LLVSQQGAQRASGHRSFRLVIVAVMASVMAIGGLAGHPAPVAAAGAKVVIVVGPVGSSTANYIYNAKKLAAQARSYGATVYELYSPHATWSRVRSVAQGANLFIYLGHGNGWPSPYAPFTVYTKDGLGLNATDGSTSNRYYGEYYVQHYLKFAPSAVVILNRLCYASGNSEWGSANPTKSTAIKRVDNYGAGFLRTGARAVFANGISSVSSIIYSLFRTTRTMRQIFWADPAATRSYAFSFASVRNAGKYGILDPMSPGRYYHSVVGDLGVTAASWRAG